MSRACVLFKKLCDVIQKQIKKSYVCLLLNTVKKKIQHILLWWLFKKIFTGQERKKEKKMYKLLRVILSTLTFNKVLFNGLQERSSFWLNARIKKLKLQTLTGIRQLSKRVLQIKKDYFGERLKQMCNMLKRWKSSYTSQRLQSDEQWSLKFDNSMQYMSCDTSSLQIDTISSIECLDIKEDVFDIQVADNNNFFANNVLIHNCMLIDDPISPDEAKSEVMRTGVNNNFHETLKSRLNSKTDWAIVIIMQRLHDDDLTGHLLELESTGQWEKWEKLIIPAIAEEDDEYRKQWESFFEKRFPLKILHQLKKEKPVVFSTQMQQNPVNKDTQEFHEEWFRYYKDEQKPAKLRIFTACDPAFSKKDSADSSCIMTAGFDWMDMYILEFTVGKYNPAELIDKLIYHHTKWNPEKIGIEAVAAQQIIGFNLRAEMQRRWLYAQIEDLKQSGDKETKIRKLIALYRNGHIYHKVGMDLLEQELKRFPRGRHDDIIDAEQMLYSMYEIMPNARGYKDNIEIKYDEMGRPLFVGMWDEDYIL